MPPHKPIKLKLDGVIEKCKPIQDLCKDDVIAPGKLALYIDLKLPDEEDPKAKPKPGKKPLTFDPMKVELAAKTRLIEIRKKVEETLVEAAKVVKEAHESTPQDFKRAKDSLEKASKFVEELLEDAPSEVREAVYRRTKLPADEMSTINDLTFKKPTIVRGSFKSDSADVLEDPPDYKDELNELWSEKNLEKVGQSEKDKVRKKQAIDCILFVKDKVAIALLGFSGSPKSNDWKKYLGEKPDHEFSGTIEPLPDKLTLKADGQLSTKKNLLQQALKEQSGLNIKFA